MICVGILAALLVNVALPSSAWRTMFALSAALPALLAAGMLLSPESPSWLVLSGQRAAAEGVARQLWGPAGPAQLGSGALECCYVCIVSEGTGQGLVAVHPPSSQRQPTLPPVFYRAQSQSLQFSGPLCTNQPSIPQPLNHTLATTPRCRPHRRCFQV